MIQRYIVFILLALIGQPATAQTAVDYSIKLTAITQESPPQITLIWDSVSLATTYQIFKKSKNSNNWGSAISFPGATDTMFVDTDVVVDSAYEYKMVALGVQQAYGYIYAGIKNPPIEYRGALVLLVDDYFLPSCAAQIDQLEQDIAGDGWEVIRHDLPRNTNDVSVKAEIQNDKLNNPNVSAVFIVGHLPVPYSGYLYPDGHPDHAGAWPADVFYADMDGLWSDALVNDANATRPENHNIPGDGKWDQSQLPSSTELQISRVDFFDMPLFNKTEEVMMTSYLNRLHRYKMDSLNINKRALIDDNFGGFGGEAFAANGWRSYPPLVGRENILETDLVNALDDSTFQWAYGCGAGSYTSAAGIGNTNSFVNNNARVIFMQMFGSYFGDWDVTNSFLRAPLCSDIPALTSCWVGRPNWFFHHMALGENIGHSAKLAQNNIYQTGLYIPSNFGARYVHIALMGDLSLRTDYIKPPSGMTATQVSDSSIFMNWAQSPDTGILGYYVYRSTSRYGKYDRISPLLTNHNFEDQGLATGTYYYQARAIKPVMTPSGMYMNISIGTISEAVAFDNTLSIAQLDNKESINVYPNPAHNDLNVGINALHTKDATVSIVDVTGRKPLSVAKKLTRGQNTVHFDVSALPAGVYTVLLQAGNNTITSQWMKAE